MSALLRSRPKFGTAANRRGVPGAAVSNRSKAPPYSITSSAMASTLGGTSRPSAFAVLRLMTSSNLVGKRSHQHGRNGAHYARARGLTPRDGPQDNPTHSRERAGSLLRRPPLA